MTAFKDTFQDKEFEAYTASKKRLAAMNSVQMGGLISSMLGSPFVEMLKKDAMAALLPKARNAKPEELEYLVSRADVPDFAKGIAYSEMARRQEEKQAKIEAAARENESYKATGSRKAKSPGSSKWLEPCKKASIFKVKEQYAKPRLWTPKGSDKAIWVNWISTHYSRDYQADRELMDTDVEYKLRQIQDMGAEAYKLFDGSSHPRNFKKDKTAFSGFKYNLDRANRYIPEGKLCFIGIYLNKITEQQFNGEFYSMELWSWGRWIPQEAGVEEAGIIR